MTAQLRFVGLDVGGTTMKAGVVDDSGKPIAQVALTTEPHRGQAWGLERMCETIRVAVDAAGLTMNDIAAIGVATPGLMDIPAGMITDPPNLKPWKNVPVRDHIKEVFKLPTAFQNDANAAALAEYWAGAGRGMRSMVMFTLGTGVGGGIIIDGNIVEGRHSFGGELGHVKIAMGGRLCGCNRRGCLEAYGSATAVTTRTLEALRAEPGRSSLVHFLETPDELTARKIFDAAKSGDQLAERIVEETAYYLALGAANVMHTVDPDMVIFGGGMVAAGDYFLSRIRRHIQSEALEIPAARTQIRFAELGSDAGFIGAAGCGRQVYYANSSSSA